VASDGDDQHYLDQIEIRLDDSPEGRGPTALALREGRAQVCNDLFADESTLPWRTDYAQRGYRASAAFPIVVDDEPGGVLSVYARECGFFQQRETGLLQEAATDVGFALELAAREAERVAARRQADLERQFSDAIIESLPGVAYFYDEAGHFLRWNHNFLSVTGYPPEAMAALHPRDFFLGEDRRRVEAAIAATFATGEGSVQAGFVARDGTTTPYYFTGRRLELTGARYLIGVGIDISAREIAEAEVRRLNRDLEARIEDRTRQLEIANRELESFSYSVSHDLRAPLRAVNGFCDVLLEDHAAQMPEQMQQSLLRIRDAGLRMGELIDDLLDFSRLSRQPLDRAPVDMTALARQAVQEAESQCNDRRIEFRIDPLPPCQGDASLLRQVWINLVSNAVKYTRGRALAVVEIGSMVRDGMPVYFVRDNGTGFDMRYAGKLFGVFQRLHRADQFEGTGVGLAIVHRVLQRHGGRIWAEAAVDRGATFHFTVSVEPTP
jgi:PAS domain S-box-containing protein